MEGAAPLLHLKCQDRCSCQKVMYRPRFFHNIKHRAKFPEQHQGEVLYVYQVHRREAGDVRQPSGRARSTLPVCMQPWVRNGEVSGAANQPKIECNQCYGSRGYWVIQKYCFTSCRCGHLGQPTFSGLQLFHMVRLEVSKPFHILIVIDNVLAKRLVRYFKESSDAW